jgi:HK97 family phage portal protein
MPNVLTRWLERRSLAAPSPALLQLFSAGPTESGAIVSPQTALSVPAVFSCCQVLSQDVARTPIKLRQKTGEDTYLDAVDHPLWEILHDLANPEMTAYQVKHALQWQLLTFGRAYAEIVRVDGRVVAIWPLASEFMRVDRTAAGVKRWTYTTAQTVTWLFDPSAPPILELVSETPITRCREIIGTAIATQQYLAKYFLNGAKPSGILSAAGSIKDETAERLRAMWATNYGGSANRGKVPVLDGGIAFTPISATNDDSQLNETLRTINEQIAGTFRVPPWKIGDLSKANYSNMESGELTYITDSLDPWFELWEEALRRDLLTTRQYGQFSVTFNRQALVRNDVRSLNASLQSGIQNGYLSQNEARKAIGLNPIPGGDTYMVNSALAPVAGKEPNAA